MAAEERSVVVGEELERDVGDHAGVVGGQEQLQPKRPLRRLAALADSVPQRPHLRVAEQAAEQVLPEAQPVLLRPPLAAQEGVEEAA